MPWGGWEFCCFMNFTVRIFLFFYMVLYYCEPAWSTLSAGKERYMTWLWPRSVQVWVRIVHISKLVVEVKTEPWFQGWIFLSFGFGPSCPARETLAPFQNSSCSVTESWWAVEPFTFALLICAWPALCKVRGQSWFITPWGERQQIPLLDGGQCHGHIAQESRGRERNIG